MDMISSAHISENHRAANPVIKLGWNSSSSAGPHAYVPTVSLPTSTVSLDEQRNLRYVCPTWILRRCLPRHHHNDKILQDQAASDVGECLWEPPENLLHVHMVFEERYERDVLIGEA